VSPIPEKAAVSYAQVSFAETKTELIILPRVSASDNLTLDVQINISSFGARPQTSSGLLAPPASNTRSYQGIVTCPNRRYVIFGGLEEESESVTERKVPILGDIPILGYLFKSHTTSSRRRRIYIFIRPVIFAGDAFDDEVRVTKHIHEDIRGSSLFKRKAPVIPDEVIDAISPDIQSYMYNLFGQGEGEYFVPNRPEPKADEKKAKPGAKRATGGAPAKALRRES